MVWHLRLDVITKILPTSYISNPKVGTVTVSPLYLKESTNNSPVQIQIVACSITKNSEPQRMLPTQYTNR